MRYYVQEINSVRDIIDDMNKNHEGFRTGYGLLDRSADFYIKQSSCTLI